MEGEFGKLTQLGGIALVFLRGSVNLKTVPPGYIHTDLEVFPAELDLSVSALVTPSGFGPLVDRMYDLPKDQEIGSIRATRDGYICVHVGQDTWVVLSRAGLM